MTSFAASYNMCTVKSSVHISVSWHVATSESISPGNLLKKQKACGWESAVFLARPHMVQIQLEFGTC